MHIDEIEGRIAKLNYAESDFDDAVKSAGHGLILEFGVYKGESLRRIASLVEPRIVYGFDSFEGLPETWREKTEEKGCFKCDPPTNLPENAWVVVGLFGDTLPGFTAQSTDYVSFVHIDCDLYSSTKTVLSALKNQLHSGAIIAFDEIVGYWGHQHHEIKAFSEFLAETGFDFDVIGRRNGCSAIVRLKR